MRSDERPPAGPRGRIGGEAETAAAAYLAGHGWTVLARNVRVGRDELDLIAVTPGPDRVLVAVEVRARSGPTFGAGVESVDARKVARLYRAASALRRAGHPALGPGPLRCAIRVDLVTLHRDRAGGWTVEAHLRGLEPPA
jgi:putative endonuclease